MAYNLGVICGVLAGVAVGLILVAIIKKCVTDKGRASMQKYDERQQIVRGRAYRMSFYILMGYVFITGVLQETSINIPVEPLMITVIGIILVCTCLAIYLTRHDAYFTLRENPKKVLIACIGIGFLNILLGIANLDRIIVDGVLTASASNFVCALAVFVIAVYALLYMKKHKLDEESDEAEDDEDEES